jgi:2-keto-4-pentenoate hydratase
MLPTDTHHTLALAVQHAQDNAKRLGLISAQHAAFSVADAYAVAQQLRQFRQSGGAVTVGRKIGFTNPQLWQQYGVAAPIWGDMFTHTVWPLARWQNGFSLRPFVQPKIEPEIVLHFHHAPSAGADAAAVLDCVDWVAHGFEIVQSHYADWKFTAADAVADGALHGALLLGPPQPVSALSPGLEAALSDLQLDLFNDQQFVQSGLGSNVMGSPLLAAAHLVAVLAEQDATWALQAGEIVTTGTLTAAYDVWPGQTWRTQISGIQLPGLQVTFTD